MAYNKTTDFAAKDALPAGDTNKIVRGSEINAEFSNIQAAFSSVNSEINNFATVATSGAYSDLSGTPTIPSAQSTAYSAVGTYIQGYQYIPTTSATGIGATIAGTGLRASTAAGTRWSAAASANLPGTWRLMGAIYKGGTAAEATAVWVRIS
mgnify:CR=1 FL=1